MAQISRRWIKPETEKTINQMIVSAIALCGSSSEAANFIDDLLTPTEKIMLAKRFAIAYLLLKGHSYGEIKDLLKVSTPTIGSVSLLLKIKGSGYKEIVQKLAARRELRKIFESLTQAAISIIGSGKGGNKKAVKYWENELNRKHKSPL